MPKDDLNPRQKAAAEKIDGPLLIIAGAGTGKTKTLTSRIANILKSGTESRQICALTFTNKAGNEMKERVEKLLFDGMSEEELQNVNIELPFIGTFHSFCLRILRTTIEEIGFKSNFAIYDTSDQLAAMKLVFQKMELDSKKYNPKIFLNRIGNYKNVNMDPDGVLQNFGNSEKLTGEIYKEYQKILKENNALDFDDILFFTVKIFQEFPQIREKFSNRYKYILVDEYQDTNHIQYLFIKMLAEKHKNICVVGDSDQSIYSFRGADIGNILSFEKDFSGAEIVRLEQNYRSTMKILKAADQVISNNTGRYQKNMFSELGEGEKIKVIKVRGEKEEANEIAEIIRTKMGENFETKLSDFAILYRTNAQSRAIEEALVKNGITYKIIGGIKFYARKEIKDILAYLKFIYSPQDSVSLLRIINVPARKIGGTTIAKMQNYAWQRTLSIGELVNHVDTIEGLSAAAKKNISAFSEIISELRKEQKTTVLSDFIDSVIEKSGYLAMLKKDDDLESKNRIDNLKELKSVAQKFDNLGEEGLGKFLEEVALVADVDSIENGENAVLLMTLHSSKGLEFKNVFIAGVEEGIFPSSRSEEDGDIEEERRLAYVGITRAKENLYLLHTGSRLLYGQFQNNPPSRFLGEISEDLADVENKDFYKNNFSGGNNFRKKKEEWDW
ncbi:UvrD-helicase domain-containing protein [Candidatus Gracilibacteria bacterium]|nr:UvrD-helicase domain-containing protein [Candidatus Gracilibacteria bacterium]